MKNPLLTFFAGLIMLTAGLFWLTSIVQVSSIWGTGWHIGSMNITGGFTLVPLIAGILWLFFDPKSKGARVLSILGVVIIIAGVIMSLRFYVHGTSLFVFIIIFVCIAGGAGLIARTLFTGRGSASNEKDSKSSGKNSDKS